MITLPFLVVFPALLAALLLLVANESWRRLAVWAGAAIIGAASLSLLFITPASGPLFCPVGEMLQLHSLIQSSHVIALVPAVLIGFAGITKSALMPFSGWPGE